MLDVSRHFYNADSIKKLLDLMSFHKLNKFHWHLVDNQGWRLPSKKYSKLNEFGSWRDGTLEIDGVDNNEKYGGYYTEEQLAGIIEYAE